MIYQNWILMIQISSFFTKRTTKIFFLTSLRAYEPAFLLPVRALFALLPLAVGGGDGEGGPALVLGGGATVGAEETEGAADTEGAAVGAA